jgi:hypothetical protein
MRRLPFLVIVVAAIALAAPCFAQHSSMPGDPPRGGHARHHNLDTADVRAEFEKMIGREGFADHLYNVPEIRALIEGRFPGTRVSHEMLWALVSEGVLKVRQLRKEFDAFKIAQGIRDAGQDRRLDEHGRRLDGVESEQKQLAGGHLLAGLLLLAAVGFALVVIVAAPRR